MSAPSAAGTWPLFAFESWSKNVISVSLQLLPPEPCTLEKSNKINTMNPNSITAQPHSPIPPDNLQRNLVVADPNHGRSLRHLGIVGDTYTILLNGEDTNGHY